MADPASGPACRMALKEWATVLEAIARGEQLLLIRKGGLIEPGSGFELMAEQFLFYPTFEHQAVNYLREPYRRYFDEALTRRAPEGRVRFGLAGTAVSSVRTQDATLVSRLGDFHIYNEAFLHQRLKWQPEQTLVLILLRAFQLPRPQEMPVAPHYAGCKSWVELATPLSLIGARPVLEDRVFQERADAIRAILNES